MNTLLTAEAAAVCQPCPERKCLQENLSSEIGILEGSRSWAASPGAAAEGSSSSSLSYPAAMGSRWDWNFFSFGHITQRLTVPSRAAAGSRHEAADLKGLTGRTFHLAKPQTFSSVIHCLVMVRCNHLSTTVPATGTTGKIGSTGVQSPTERPRRVPAVAQVRQRLEEPPWQH